MGSPLGKVGRDVTLAEAVAAAQLTALNVLGTIERELGGLDTVAGWLKITATSTRSRASPSTPS